MVPPLLLTFFGLFFLPTFIHAQALTTTVPTVFTMGFEWSTNFDSSMQIPSCGTVQFNYQALSGSTVTPKGPFKIWVIVPNSPIYRYVTTTADFPGQATFQLGVAAGNQVAFLMEDANGYSGGAVGPYTVTAGTATCTIYGSQGQLGIEVTPGYQTCGAIAVVVTGGTAPYYYHLVEADVAHAFVGGGSVNSNSFTLDPTSVVTHGQYFSIWVQDNSGLYTVNFQILNAAGSSTCNSISSSQSLSSSSSSTTTSSSSSSLTTTTSSQQSSSQSSSSSSSSGSSRLSSSSTTSTSGSKTSTSTSTTTSATATPSVLSLSVGNPVAGQNLKITPSGGLAPYTITVLFGNVVEGTQVVQAGGTYEWPVSLAVGSLFTISVTDARGTSYVTPSYNVAEKKKSSHIGAIVGGVVGGIGALVLALILWWFCCRGRDPHRNDDIDLPDRYHPPPPGPTPTLPPIDVEPYPATNEYQSVNNGHYPPSHDQNPYPNENGYYPNQNGGYPSNQNYPPNQNAYQPSQNPYPPAQNPTIPPPLPPGHGSVPVQQSPQMQQQSFQMPQPQQPIWDQDGNPIWGRDGNLQHGVSGGTPPVDMGVNAGTSGEAAGEGYQDMVMHRPS